MSIEMTPAVKGLITKAKNGTAPRQTVFAKVLGICLTAGIPKQQAKHFTRKVLA